jgi:23S rRNA pseudouridine1911/1915/1917 synthase
MRYKENPSSPHPSHLATSSSPPPLPLINSSFTGTIRNPHGAALLDYLALRFPYHTFDQWRNLIALGRLAIDGRTASADETVREGQVLRFAVVDYDEPEVPVDFKVLERRGEVCFVHKPAGLPVHRTGKIFFQTLANLLRESLGDSGWAPLNRLDRETGGLVAFARGQEALRLNSPANPEVRWTKLYLAVARGRLPEDEGAFDWALCERAGDVIRSRMHAMPKGKPALTLHRTLAHRGGFSLVLLSPVTGRKHQLRAHLAQAGCPIVGDKLYSLEGRPYLKRVESELDEADFRELGARNHLLHAFYLRLEPRSEGAPADGATLEAWDWDMSGEFAAYFDLREARELCEGGESAAMQERVRELRSLPGLTPEG